MNDPAKALTDELMLRGFIMFRWADGSSCYRDRAEVIAAIRRHYPETKKPARKKGRKLT